MNYKATHDAAHYYASYDLLKVPIQLSLHWGISRMKQHKIFCFALIPYDYLLSHLLVLVFDILKTKVNNAVNTTVLIDKVLEDMGKGPMDQINEKEFRAVVCEILTRISLLGRWTGGVAWGSDYAEDEELMRRLGEIFRLDSFQ